MPTNYCGTNEQKSFKYVTHDVNLAEKQVCHTFLAKRLRKCIIK